MTFSNTKYLRFIASLLLFVFCLFAFPKSAAASTCEDGRGTTAKVSGRVWETINYGNQKGSISVANATVRITRGDSTLTNPRFVDLPTGSRNVLKPTGSSPQQGATLTKTSDSYLPSDAPGPDQGIYDLCGFIYDADVFGVNDARTRFTVSVLNVPSGYDVNTAGAVFPPDYLLSRTSEIGWTQDLITKKGTLLGASAYTNQYANSSASAAGGVTSCNANASIVDGNGTPIIKYRCDFKIAKQATVQQTEIAGRVAIVNSANAVTGYFQNANPTVAGSCGNYAFSPSLRVNLTSRQGATTFTNNLLLNNCNPQPFYTSGKIAPRDYQLSIDPLKVPGYTCSYWVYSRYNNTTAKWEQTARGNGCTMPSRMLGVQASPYHNSHHIWFYLTKNAVPTTVNTPTTVKSTLTPTRKLTPTSTVLPITLSCTINDNGHGANVVANDRINVQVVPSVQGATTQQLTYAWSSMAFKDNLVSDTSPIKVGTFAPLTSSTSLWTGPTTLPQDKNKILLRASVVATSGGRVVRATCDKVYGILGNCSQPVDVMFVIDRSSSMLSKGPNGKSKLDEAKAAAITFIDTMKTTYAGRNGSVRVGLVTFGRTLTSTQGTTVALSSNLDDVKARILAVTKDESGTCIECGLAVANNNLASVNPKGAAQKIVIVLTDGRANRSIASNGRDIDDEAIQPALDMAQSGKEEGYTYFVVGVSSSSSPEKPCTTRGYTTDCTNVAGIAGYNGMPQSEVDNFYKKSSLDTSSEWAELFKRFKETICTSPKVQTVLGATTEAQPTGIFGTIKNFVLHTFGY